MPFIFTPGQLNRRAEFYRQLAQYTSAGIGLIAALDQLQQHPPAPSYRRPLENLVKSLADFESKMASRKRLIAIWNNRSDASAA